MANLNVKDLPSELWYSCITLQIVAISLTAYYILIVFFLLWKKIYKTSKLSINKYKHIVNFPELYAKTDKKSENQIGTNTDIKNKINDNNKDNDNDNNNNKELNSNNSTSENKQKKQKKFTSKTNKDEKKTRKNLKIKRNSGSSNSNSNTKAEKPDGDIIESTNDFNLTNRNLIPEKTQKLKGINNFDQQDINSKNFIMIMKKIQLDKFELRDLDPKKLKTNDLRFIYFSYLKVKLFIIVTIIIMALDIFSEIEFYLNISIRFKNTRYVLYEKSLVNSVFFELENKTISESAILDHFLIDKILKDPTFNLTDSVYTPTSIIEFFSLNQKYNISVTFATSIANSEIASCTKYNEAELESLRIIFSEIFTGSVTFFLYYNIFISIFALYLNFLRSFLYIKSSIFFKLKQNNRVKITQDVGKTKKKVNKKAKNKKRIETENDSGSSEDESQEDENELNLNIKNYSNKNKINKNNNDNKNIEINKTDNYATLNNLNMTANFDSGESNFLYKTILKKISNAKISFTISNFFNNFLKKSDIIDTRNNWFINLIIFIFSRSLITVYIAFSQAQPINDCFNYETNDLINKLIPIFYFGKILSVYIFFLLGIGYLFIYKKALVAFIKYIYLLLNCPLYLCLVFRNFFLKDRENMNTVNERIFRKLGFREELCCYKSSKERYKGFILIRCLCDSWAEAFYTVYTWIFILVTALMGLTCLLLNLCMHFLWFKTLNISFMRASIASLFGSFLSFILYLLS